MKVSHHLRKHRQIDSITDILVRITNKSDDRNIVHNIYMIFKKNEEFSEIIFEDINEFIAVYMKTAADSQLSSTENAAISS